MLKYIFYLISIVSIYSLNAQTINVASASSNRYVLEELVNVFKQKNPEVELNVINQSSGKISSQVMMGAPYDLFISANEQYAMFVHQQKKGIEKPEVWLKGELAIWTRKNTSIDTVLKTAQKIAIANDRYAPFGKLAIQYMKDKGIYEKAKVNVMPLSNVAMVNQCIEMNMADIAFTSNSLPAIKKDVLLGRWVHAKFYTTSNYLLLLREEARVFYNFLLSDEATAISKKYGYR